MSRIVVHECDWCKKRVEWRIPFNQTSVSVAEMPTGHGQWKMVQDDNVVAELICDVCRIRRGVTLEQEKCRVRSESTINTAKQVSSVGEESKK